ncbi:MAG: hypothetical protein AB7O59_00225 [Pirellulales bacterium]
MGDSSFTGVIQLTDNLALRAGYQLLWVSGVATASDQLPATSLDTSGDVFLHGALVGAEAGW